MQKRKIEIKNFIGWQEILALAAILAGITFIVVTDQIEIKFIGIALVILSFVGLVLLLAQKMSDYVEPQKMRGAAPTPNFKVTVRQDSQAKRVVIEDFDSTIAEEEVRETINRSNVIQNTEGEGFRIIRKVAHSNITSSINEPEVKEENPNKDKYRENLYVTEAKEVETIPQPQVEETNESIDTYTEINKDIPSITFDDEPTNAFAIEEEIIEEIQEKEIEAINEVIAENLETTEEIWEEEQEPIDGIEILDIEPVLSVINEETILQEQLVIEEDEVEVSTENILIQKFTEAEDLIEVVTEQEKDIVEIEEEINVSEIKEETQIQSASNDLAPQKAAAFNDSGFKIVIRTKDLSNETINTENTGVENVGPIIETTTNIIVENNQSLDAVVEDKDIEFEIPQNTLSFEEFKQSLDEELERKPEIPEVVIAAKQDYKQNDVDLSQINTEEEVLTSDEPRKEFNYLLTKILLSVRSVSNTKTALLILVNQERGELILESYVTENQDSFIKGRKIKIGNDIVSQIVKTGKPEILSEINPSAELDLIPYYTQNTQTGSFVGMPVFFENKVIGVLCADSDDAEAYDNLIVGFLGHFTQIISITLKNFTEKYDLIQDSKTLQYIKFFQNIANTATDYDEVNSALIEAVAKIIDCTAIGIAAYDAESGWHINMLSSVYNEYSNYIGRKIEIENSIIGMSIREMGIKIYNPIDNDYIRVFPEEKPQVGGYFLTIPLVANGSSFGALFVEGEKSEVLTEVEIELIRTIVTFANTSIEKLHYIELLKNGIVIDPNTGVMNFTAFSDRLKEEMYKAAEFEQLSILAFAKIDKYSSFDPINYSERFKFAKSVLIKNINKNSRVFDLVGEVDDSTIAVLLVGYNLNQSKLWAEKLRKEVASNTFEYEGHKYNITISLGLAEITGASNVAGLYNNADTALNLSLEQTNAVSIYS